MQPPIQPPIATRRRAAATAERATARRPAVKIGGRPADDRAARGDGPGWASGRPGVAQAKMACSGPAALPASVWATSWQRILVSIVGPVSYGANRAARRAGMWCQAARFAVIADAEWIQGRGFVEWRRRRYRPCMVTESNGSGVSEDYSFY